MRSFRLLAVLLVGLSGLSCKHYKMQADLNDLSISPTGVTVVVLGTALVSCDWSTLGSTAESPGIQWTSSDANIASVATGSFTGPGQCPGVVTGVAVGSALVTVTVTLTDGPEGAVKSQSIPVTVTAIPVPSSVNSVTPTPPAAAITAGNTLPVSASASVSGGGAVVWTWSSSNCLIACPTQTSPLRQGAPGASLMTDPISNATISAVAVGHADITVEARIGEKKKSAVISIDVTAVPACAGLVEISDDFESAKTWTHTVASATGGATAPTPTRPTSGGFPNGYMQMQHVEPPNSYIQVVHILEVPYDPSGTGNAIHHVNYSEDRIELFPPFTGAAIGSAFIVMQGSTVLQKNIDPPASTFANTAWASRSITLTAADLPGINLAGGGPIKFGFQRSNTNSATSGNPFTTTNGIDNFKVQICH